MFSLNQAESVEKQGVFNNFKVETLEAFILT